MAISKLCKIIDKHKQQTIPLGDNIISDIIVVNPKGLVTPFATRFDRVWSAAAANYEHIFNTTPKLMCTTNTNTNCLYKYMYFTKTRIIV